MKGYTQSKFKHNQQPLLRLISLSFAEEAVIQIIQCETVTIQLVLIVIACIRIYSDM